MKNISLILLCILLLASCKKESSTESTNKAPNAPSNPSPASNATNQYDSLTLSWSCTDPENDALTYDVYFGTANPPTTVVSQNQTAITLTRSGLSLNTTFYWKVLAKDNHSHSTSGAVWNFTTRASIVIGNIEMISVQGGTFSMGSNVNSDEQPIHSVTLSSFYISKYEITQAQWKQVIVWKQANGGTTLSATPSYFSGDTTKPVEQVSWDDIQLWLGYLNTMYNVTGNQYRLPTEAEWEYAARGGIHASDNYTYSGSNTVGDVAWYYVNSSNTTHPVGTKTPNQLGIYDMSGNVWEWCQDYYHSNYSGAPTDGSAWVTPTSNYRVLRGGSWDNDDTGCRVALRDISNPHNRYDVYGFRLVRTP